MTKEQYQSFSLISLREMAKARGMTKISALRKEQLIEAGVPAGLVRISCGLEDKEDLIADLKQALDAI